MDGRLPGRREATGRQNPAYSPARLPLGIFAGQRTCLLHEQTLGVEFGANLRTGIVVSVFCPTPPIRANPVPGEVNWRSGVENSASVYRPCCIFGHSGWQAWSRASQLQTSRTPKRSEVHVRAVSLLTPLGWGATRGWPPGSAARRGGPRSQRNDQYQALCPRGPIAGVPHPPVIVRVGQGDDGGATTNSSRAPCPRPSRRR